MRPLVVVLALLAAAPARADEARTFAGSIQLDFLAVPTEARARQFTLDGATVELSLKLTADIEAHTTASVKVCFACHGFEVGMATLEFRVADELRVRVGRMTPAFGNFPRRHDPANHRTSDKPLPYDMGRSLHRVDWNEGILPAPWVDNGVEVGGTHLFDGGRIDYAVFAISGPRGTADAADFDFVASRSPEAYYVDNNSQPAAGARLAGALDIGATGSLELGVSAMAGHYDDAAELAFAIAGADAVLDVERAVVRAEYLVRRTEMFIGADPASRFKFGPDADGTYDDAFVKHGFYVEGEVPIDTVSLIARWDGLLRSGNVLAASVLDERTSVLRYTAAAAVRLATIMVKTSIELYQFHELDDELAIHVGVAAPF